MREDGGGCLVIEWIEWKMREIYGLGIIKEEDGFSEHGI